MKNFKLACIVLVAFLLGYLVCHFRITSNIDQCLISQRALDFETGAIYDRQI